ncbi:hypothetical protein [Haloferax denitrificans]|uniref:hypothetical protein n=1 Tax=Haloferax denitrificans TaxID=35745 RepID=UPI003C6FADBF
MLSKHALREFSRCHYPVDNYHGVPIYIDEEGRKCPAATYVIEQMYQTGRIHPPAHSTDGYDRTTSRPDIIFWVAKMRGRLMHERIAAKMDDDYDWDIHPIIRDIRDCNGVDATRHEVVSAIAEYRDEHIRMYPVNIIERDVQSLLRAWDKWWDRRCYIDHNRWEIIRAELGLIGDHHSWDARWGVRPDLIAHDHGEDDAVGICLKTGHHITDAHRTQAVVTLLGTTYLDRVVIVRLDVEREWYDTEVIDESDVEEQPFTGFYSGFCKELVKIYRSIN